jgi:sugar lactone lactonase YvrE
MSGPVSGYFDGTKLYVADTGNNRVLIWNSLPTSTSQLPDVVLGQTDLCTFTHGTTASTFVGPTGILTFGTRLFVADTGNNRVLVWNTIPTTNGQAADYVIGQDDFITGTPNSGGVNDSYLNSPTSIAFDGATNFFISDTGNNRVLGWTYLPGSATPADYVLGQSSIYSNTPNAGGLSGSSMFTPQQIYHDGGRLFVADYDNNRVLVWTSLTGVNGQPADLVLGQPDFISNAGGTTATTLVLPYGVYSDGTKVYVSDYGNRRILGWNSLPSGNGQAADFVLGQPNFTSQISNNGGISASTLNRTLHVFGNNAKLFSADLTNNRILIWNSLPSTTSQPADYVLGQPDMISSNSNSTGVSSTNLSLIHSAYSDGSRLYVADTSNNRVLIWNSIPTSNGQPADIVLGQPSFTSSTGNNGGISASSLNAPRSVYSDGTRLFVADTSNHRILVWNSIPTTHGQAANFVLGQPNLTSNTLNNGGISSSRIYFPSGVFGDGTRLFVADTNNHRVLIWNTLPTSNGQAADLVLGQSFFNTNAAGTTNATLRFPASVYSDGTHLFVADTSNYRVMAWNTLPTSNGQAADFVLGQPNFTSATVNNGGISASRMSYPKSVFGDGLRLFVADYTNSRVLVWNTLPTATAQAANYAIGQANLVSNTPNSGGLSATSLYGPNSVISDGARVFISDIINSRLIVMPIPGI